MMATYDTFGNILALYNNDNESEKGKYIIVTGGIGDFVSLDYIYNYSSNNNIIFISGQALVLKELLSAVNKSNKFFALRYNFSTLGKPGFNGRNELLNHMPEFLQLSNIPIIDISDMFPSMLQNRIRKNYNVSNLILDTKILPHIKEKFRLPDNIAFISPFTEDRRIDCIRCGRNHTRETSRRCMLTRNFLKCDYIQTYNILHNRDLLGVIVSSSPIYIPEKIRHRFINLSGQTNIVEAIEILKYCKTYIGIDNVFSVFATKLLGSRNIFIKSNNRHLYKNLRAYYAPYNIRTLNISSFIHTL